MYDRQSKLLIQINYIHEHFYSKQIWLRFEIYLKANQSPFSTPVNKTRNKTFSTPNSFSLKKLIYLILYFYDIFFYCYDE